MIYINEQTLEDGSTIIKVDGFLNRKTIGPLSDICSRYLAENTAIALDLAGLTHTDESARKYLSDLGQHVVFRNAPKFLRIDKDAL